MKQTSLFLLLAVFVSIATPQSASALSCLDPISSIEYYVENEGNSIFTATAGNVVEHTTKKATTDGNPNSRHDAGYVGQYVFVSEVHKGSMQSEAWIYYSVDSTWGYMCTSQPPEAGTTNIYVVNKGNGSFDLPSVVQVIAVDSDIADALLAAVESADVNGFLQEKDAETWTQDLGNTLRRMVTILRIRLAEWRFWRDL